MQVFPEEGNNESKYELLTKRRTNCQGWLLWTTSGETQEKGQLLMKFGHDSSTLKTNLPHCPDGETVNWLPSTVEYLDSADQKASHWHSVVN